MMPCAKPGLSSAKSDIAAGGARLTARMGVPVAGEWLALTYWLFFTNPGVFGANQRLLQFAQIQALQQLAAKGREIYFREFMAGYRAGTINFRDNRLGMGSETSPRDIP
jgi:hypothetical protein